MAQYILQLSPVNKGKFLAGSSYRRELRKRQKQFLEQGAKIAGINEPTVRDYLVAQQSSKSKWHPLEQEIVKTSR